MPYRLHDFLLFSPRTYYRLIEAYNRDVWPLHIAALAAGVLVLRYRRMTGPVLAAAWLWVGWAFMLKRYATINWGVKYIAIAFAIEALICLVPKFDEPSRPGIALFAFALFIEPLLSLPSPATAEVFGIMPDPTAVGTLGLALCARGRVRWILMIVPLLWCAIGAATWWAMR